MKILFIENVIIYMKYLRIVQQKETSRIANRKTVFCLVDVNISNFAITMPTLNITIYVHHQDYKSIKFRVLVLHLWLSLK